MIFRNSLVMLIMFSTDRNHRPCVSKRSPSSTTILCVLCVIGDRTVMTVRGVSTGWGTHTRRLSCSLRRTFQTCQNDCSRRPRCPCRSSHHCHCGVIYRRLSLSLSDVVMTKNVYYESIKWEVKIKPIFECRCDERLNPKSEESTRLVYNGLSISEWIWTVVH